MLPVKICGITNPEDGLHAAELGADYIGFLFYDKSPRYITPEQGRDISRKVTNVKKVGLFVNETPEQVRKIAESVGLDVLQFHGDESPDYCRAFQDWQVWKAIRVKNAESLVVLPNYDSIDAFVLDTHVDGAVGGTGKTFDWKLAIQAKEYGKRIILAGGLDAANVREAIAQVRPFAVDACSGTEVTAGKKSYDKLKAFLTAIKTA